MSMTPHPNDGEPTVVMPDRAVEDASMIEALQWLAATRRRRTRRLSFLAVAGFACIAAMAVGWLLFQRNEKLLAVSGQPAREVGPTPVMPPASQPAPPPSPRTADRPSSPRQMFSEIFEGRDREHSVAASVDKGAIRISSSKPGYVYVLAAPADQSDAAMGFVVVLFPEAADTDNRIRPGQALKLPDLPWAPNAELLALVSEEPRDIDALGSLAGNVICGARAQCSESYGAVVFSRGAVVSSRDDTRATARRPATSTAPGARPTSTAPRRCSDILERASLGEPLTDEEQTFLRRDCR